MQLRKQQSQCPQPQQTDYAAGTSPPVTDGFSFSAAISEHAEVAVEVDGPSLISKEPACAPSGAAGVASHATP
eukprot:11707806-Karenia_brevis.AAC.1